MLINKDKFKTTAIIVAGGTGSRMKSKIPKQFIIFNKKPILIHTLSIFESCNLIRDIILVCLKDYISYCESLIKKYSLKKIKKIIPGGDQRQSSVYNALKYIDSNKTNIISIHDGVRPFVKSNIIYKTILACENNYGCICGIKSKDTVKLCLDKHHNNNFIIKETLPRENIFLAYTPQTFKANILKYVYKRALKENFFCTDDASLLEHYNYKIKIIESNPENIKITTPEDLLFARAYLNLKNK